MIKYFVETPTKIIAAEENISNSCPVTSLNVKKRLAFDIPERHCSLSPSVFSGVKKLKNIGKLWYYCKSTEIKLKINKF